MSSENLKNKIFLMACIILAFVVLPTCFALSDENQTLSEDYYFDASQNATDVYELSSTQIVNNSVIHLTDGVYELNKGKTINNISIIGQSAEKTIIKFKNNNSILTSMGSLTLKDVTLLDVSIINYATLNASNTVFKNSVAYFKYTNASNIVNSASNSYGGAIYCPYYDKLTANVYLDNCTFVNNTAEYGGAIYMCAGNLDIKNCLFLDNFAYNYGGAIACEYSATAKIDKSEFTNSKSINDAGGAIYLKLSKLTANNVNITNSNATFGGAITSLESKLQVGSLNFVNNTAKYEGGAIYQLYGTLTTRNSNYINNSAANGGAIFADNTTSMIFYQNKFKENSALNYAGAVYSLLNTKTRINFDEYYDNTAKIENDFYDTNTISIIIENDNYTMYKSNSSYNGSLPSYYSLVDDGYVTSIKDQQAGGNCWAFAGLAVLESCILKASGENLDLSEENMKNIMSIYSDYGWNMDTNAGGYPSMIMTYLLSWMGPVLENDDKYDDYSTLSGLLKSIMHVQNIKYIKRSSYTDNDGIKEAILKYGAVGTGIYFDYDYYNNETYAYYGALTTLTNHAVAIVGWNDTYSKENFVNTPRADGAWIVKNSWGDDWGDNGYFYVSYYDISFARVGDGEVSYTFVFNDTVKYDKNYQYDIGKTDYFITYDDAVWYQNIFNATDNEYLAAVSTYFEKECEWDLSVYVNDEFRLTKSGIGDTGYYTIDLGDYVKLNLGDIFKVVFKITASGASFPISEKVKSNKVVYHEGISFFSSDGVNWKDLYNYTGYVEGHTYDSQVACIKAFTFKDEIASEVMLNVTSGYYNPFNVVANVLNEYGNPVTSGEVIFTVDGVNYTQKVVDGFCRLTLSLNEFGGHDINATFYACGYLTSSACESVKIMPRITSNKDLTMYFSSGESYNVLVYGDDGNVSGAGEIVVFKIGGNTYKVETDKNGYASLKITLKAKTYTITAEYKGYKVSNKVVVKPVLTAKDVSVKKSKKVKFSAKLVNGKGKPLKAKKITFKFKGKKYVSKTNKKGIATLSIKQSLKIGKYVIYSTYLKSTIKNYIKIK